MQKKYYTHEVALTKDNSKRDFQNVGIVSSKKNFKKENQGFVDVIVLNDFF